MKVQQEVDRFANTAAHRKSSAMRILGSAGSLPAVAGSLPATLLFGRLPKSTGWQPALPKPRTNVAYIR